jgi:PAS domain S-box-containing protein
MIINQLKIAALNLPLAPLQAVQRPPRASLAHSLNIKLYDTAFHFLVGPWTQNLVLIFGLLVLLLAAIVLLLLVGRRSRLVQADNRKFKKEIAVKALASQSELERNVRALRESEQRLQSVIENLSLGLIISDLNGEVLHWNKAALELHGFTSSEECDLSRAALTKVFELSELDGAVLDLEQWPLRRIIHGERLNDVELRVRRIDLSWNRIFSYSGAILRESAGTCVAFVTITDLTQRKRAEEECRQLASIVESSEDAIIGKTLAGIVTSWNRGAQELYGYSAEEVVGRSIAILAPPEHSNEVTSILEKLILGDNLEHFETERISKDGQRISVSLTISPIRDASQRLVGASTIARNITKRKRAEQEQHASELRYRRLFESARDGILILNGDSGKIVDVNPYLIDLLRYPREELIGKELWQVGTFKDISASKAAFVELQERDFVRYDDLPLESGEGTVTQVEVVANGYLEGDTRVVQCNIRDVTKRKLAEDVLKETNSRLEHALVDLKAKTSDLTAMTQQLWQASKLTTMGELAASIAHELNNPLTTISLRIDSLADDFSDDEEKSHTLKIIADEIERMGKLVGRLLQFSRHSGQEMSTLNIREEFENSMELFEYHLRAKGIEVVREFDATLPTVQADRQQLRQIFLNLLTNASDAMPLGGTLVTRLISVDPESGVRGVRLELSDSGPGITPADLKQIWEPFFTTKPEGKGTGLGLAITRRAIEAHHGTISIESELGKGTTVTMFLPAINNVRPNFDHND